MKIRNNFSPLMLLPASQTRLVKIFHAKIRIVNFFRPRTFSLFQTFSFTIECKFKPLCLESVPALCCLLRWLQCVTAKAEVYGQSAAVNSICMGHFCATEFPAETAWILKRPIIAYLAFIFALRNNRFREKRKLIATLCSANIRRERIDKKYLPRP